MQNLCPSPWRFLYFATVATSVFMVETSESSGLSGPANESSSEYGSEANSADLRGESLPAEVSPDPESDYFQDSEDITSELLNAEPSYPPGLVKGTAGYAKLSGIGRGAIDYLVRTKSFTIGRTGAGADCQLRSDGRTVSRLHATIQWVNEAETWAISCHSKSNALMVDGAPVVVDSPPMPLRSRVLIEVGDASFFFLAAVEPFCRAGDVSVLEDKIDAMRAARKAKEEEEEVLKARSNATSAWTSANSRPSGSNRRSRRDNESDDEYGDDEVAQIDAGFAQSDAGFDGASHVDEEAYSDDDDDVFLVIDKRSSHRGSKKRKRSVSDDDDDDDEARRRRRKDRRKKKKKKKKKKRRLEASQAQHPHGGETEDDDEQMEDLEQIEATVRMEDDGLHLRGGHRTRQPSHPRARNPEAVRAEWNKKERADFCRAIFAVDVDKVYDQDGNLVTYDWGRFRGIARLEKKSDAMLTEFYHRMMTDMEGLLEDEAREKRTKGPRTKHKPGCDCVVCENTRKSRRKKEEENKDEPEGTDADTGGNREEDEVNEELEDSGGAHGDDTKSVGDHADADASKPRPERVLGLVTAQKLRVRMGIHEAARQVDSPAGQAVMRKLRSQSRGSAANGDLPDWWENGVHDHALMIGTARYGVGQWYDIWLDAHNPEFMTVRQEVDGSVEWPTTQTGMKRLREVSSAINAELRRVAKKRARRSEDVPIVARSDGSVRKGSTSNKRSARDSGGTGKGRRKGRGSRSRQSDDDFDDDDLCASGTRRSSPSEEGDEVDGYGGPDETERNERRDDINSEVSSSYGEGESDENEEYLDHEGAIAKARLSALSDQLRIRDGDGYDGGYDFGFGEGYVEGEDVENEYGDAGEHDEEEGNTGHVDEEIELEMEEVVVEESSDDASDFSK